MTDTGVLCDDQITLADVRHIVRNLRDRDRREIYALRWDDDEELLAKTIFASAGPMWRLWRWKGEPVAMNGVIPQRPGVASANAFGTDKFRFVLRPMMRWSTEVVIPALRKHGYHRGEAYVLAANGDGRRLVHALGGRPEAYLSQFGRDQEDFILYTWRLADVL